METLFMYLLKNYSKDYGKVWHTPTIVKKDLLFLYLLMILLIDLTWCM